MDDFESFALELACFFGIVASIGTFSSCLVIGFYELFLR